MPQNKSLQEEINSWAKEKKLAYFLYKAAKEGQSWGIQAGEGLLIISDEKGRQLLPLWPDKALASAYLEAQEGHKPFSVEAVALSELIEEWLPELSLQRMRVVLYLAPDQKSGMLMEPNILAGWLTNKLQAAGEKEGKEEIIDPNEKK